MLGLGLNLAALQRPQGSAAPGPVMLPVTPTSRWHPAYSSVVESGGRVVSASDLTGLAAATEGGAGIGPRVLTDGLGRRFWRFEGTEYLTVATTLTFANTRETTVFCVGRVHRQARIFSGGSVAAGTAGNGAALLDARVGLSGEAPMVGNARVAATGRENMVVGTQLSVLGQLRRLTANGGDQSFLNRKTCVVGVQGSGTLAVNGGEIGRYAFSPGASGTWANFDLYELVVYNARLTPAEAQAVAAALADGWAIPEIGNQLILEGDSITQGTGGVTSGLNPAMILTEPGTGRIPATWRVLNQGVSGNQVPNLVSRRDTALSWATQLLPGQNVMAVEIGRNDMVGSGGNLTAAQHYANVVAYLNTATTGVLQRGWTVRLLANIAGPAAFNASHINPYRAMVRNPQFLADTATGSGQAFAGRLGIVDTDLITVGGETVFLDGTDAVDPAYYAGDSTHPTYLGQLARMLGGDTPARGVAAGLV